MPQTLTKRFTRISCLLSQRTAEANGIRNTTPTVTFTITTSSAARQDGVSTKQKRVSGKSTKTNREMCITRTTLRAIKLMNSQKYHLLPYRFWWMIFIKIFIILRYTSPIIKRRYYCTIDKTPENVNAIRKRFPSSAFPSLLFFHSTFFSQMHLLMEYQHPQRNLHGIKESTRKPEHRFTSTLSLLRQQRKSLPADGFAATKRWRNGERQKRKERRKKRQRDVLRWEQSYHLLPAADKHILFRPLQSSRRRRSLSVNEARVCQTALLVTDLQCRSHRRDRTRRKRHE